MGRSYVSNYPDDWYQHGVELYGSLSMVERSEQAMAVASGPDASRAGILFSSAFFDRYFKDFHAAGPYRTPPSLSLSCAV